MIDKLLEQKKITLKEYDVYMLFKASESGQRWFKDMVHQTFMETPIVNPDNLNAITLGVQDGRRDIFRQIQLTFDKIFRLLEDTKNDDRSSDKDGIDGHNELDFYQPESELPRIDNE